MPRPAELAPDPAHDQISLQPFRLLIRDGRTEGYAVYRHVHEPRGRVTLLGDAESEKSGAGLTVRLMVVVWVRLPEVPVMVTVTVPVVAVPLAVSVNVLVLVVLDGLNEAVTPLGNPEADKLTLPVNPLRGLTVIVLVPLLP